MEYHHDFIQWLFPLREPSQFNPDAPVLSDEDIRIFREDASLRENLARSFERFLSFLGLARDEAHRPRARFRAQEWRVHQPQLQLAANHSACLTSLRLLGLEADGQAFFACLQDLVKNGQAKVSNDTIAYRQNATFPHRPMQG